MEKLLSALRLGWPFRVVPGCRERTRPVPASIMEVAQGRDHGFGKTTVFNGSNLV